MKKLSDAVLIPSAVKQEILTGGKSLAGVEEMKKADWLEVMEVQNLYFTNS